MFRRCAALALLLPGLATIDAAASAAAPEEVAEALPPASDTETQVADWVIASGDNNGLPFMVVDKVAAGVWVYDAKGVSMGSAPVLVGITAGDDAEEGVGDRELSDIPPEQRTTPAGRFVASFGRARGGRNVLWVDYPTAISMHAVVTHNKKEHRLQRLGTATPDDNRITFGCINVPAAFYKNVVRTLLGKESGIVYVLPDTKPLTEVFPAFRPQPQQNAFSSNLRR